MNTFSHIHHDHPFPHIQFGLPMYYVVDLSDRDAVGYTEALERVNKIHSKHYIGVFLFYGFDTKVRGSLTMPEYNMPVRKYTLNEFLKATEKHFNPAQK